MEGEPKAAAVSVHLYFESCKIEDTWFLLRSCGVTCHSHGTKIFIKVENFYSAAEDG